MDDTLANSIVKAFAYTENGGKPDIENPKAGKTGEMKSIFQFEPATWKQDAKKYLHDENAPLTSDAETYVMKQKVEGWMKKGYTVSQMASMHNAGESEPDAYTGKFSTGKASKGVNAKYGVGYDVPDYAKKVLTYSKKFFADNEVKKAGNTPQQSMQTETTTPQTTSQQGDAASNLMALIRGAGQSSQPRTPSPAPVSTGTTPGLVSPTKKVPI